MTYMASLSALRKRVLRLNVEKILRHSRWAIYDSYVRVQRACGIRYPQWIDKIATHLTIAEKQTLYNLARTLPPACIVVEIGSYHGASAACLASGIQGIDSRVYCIDTWMNDAVTDARMDVLAVFRRNVALVADRLIEVRGYSHQVAHQVPGNIALLFIDGDHSYDGVSNDLEIYLPKMQAGGTIVMHDYSHVSVRQSIRDHLSSRARVVLSLENLMVAALRS